MLQIEKFVKRDSVLVLERLVELCSVVRKSACARAG